MMLKVSLLSMKTLLECPQLAGLSLRRLPSHPSDSLRVRCKSIAGRAWRTYSNISSDTQSQPTAHTHLTLKQSRKIRTLDPAKLTPDDYIDFSGKVQPSVHIILRSTNSTAGSHSPRIFTASEGDWNPRRYPPGTHGFMYYHVPPNASPLAGELRFRITPSPDPAGFAAGADLLLECGLPWRYPLYKIMVRPDAIATLLLQDGLVSQRTFDLATAATPSVRPRKTLLDVTRKANLVSTLPTLSAFGQEFIYHFTARSTCLCLFVGPEAIHKHHIWWVADFQVRVDGKPVKYCPFEGHVVCSFERSNLPQHAGKRVVVIRVKRCIDVKPVPAPNGQIYPEVLMPREGEILYVMHHNKLQPWAVDVDKGGKIKRALRVFFENEELYGSSQR